MLVSCRTWLETALAIYTSDGPNNVPLVFQNGVGMVCDLSDLVHLPDSATRHPGE